MKKLFHCIQLASLAIVIGCCNSQPVNPAGAPTRTPAPQVLPSANTAPPPSPTKKSVSPLRELTWQYPDGGLGPTVVHVTLPADASDQRRFPVLILLHGRGEALKSPAQGALGWPYDYGLLHAIQRLHHPPLTPEDFGEMVTGHRLSTINHQLAETPFRGLIVVSPYIPDRFGRTMQKDAEKFGAFLTSTLLPRIYRELPAIGTPDTTAIDGVSLGGRAAIFTGLSYPNHFGAVGGIQAALGNRQIAAVIRKLQTARKENPLLGFHLMTSTKDVYLEINRSLSAALSAHHLAHTRVIAEGDHSYEFNRGPGALETLLHYDRVLWKDQMSRF